MYVMYLNNVKDLFLRAWWFRGRRSREVDPDNKEVHQGTHQEEIHEDLAVVGALVQHQDGPPSAPLYPGLQVFTLLTPYFLPLVAFYFQLGFELFYAFPLAYFY